MTNKISIGIQASLDTQAVEQKLNDLGAKVAQANKMQFTGVSVKGGDDLQKITKQFDQYIKLQDGFKKRLKQTGQEGRAIWDVDLDQAFPDPNSRARQSKKLLEYVLGNGVFGSTPAPSTPQQRPPTDAKPNQSPPSQQKPQGGGMGAVVNQVAQAGLRAAGPAGSVVGGAINTGLSAGAGAGLMGLMGGLLAMGVGKIVGGVMEKIDQAEDNSVALDKLKRIIGDVSVSFEALKKVVNVSADNMHVTYAEAGRLATQFVKLGNVARDQYATVGQETEVSVGAAKAFGMDNSQMTAILGQMRGVGVTSNTQESRRFAAMIGEAVSKANAFAKADEMFDAIAGFAQSQTRQNLSVANVGDYAGLLSGMVGSGMPGLDVSGSAALINKINATLSAGGAKGEASQFFSGSVGTSMGLNPYQTRILREGGAFATNDAMFGKDSAYARYKGGAGPTGGDTFLQRTLERLRAQYGDKSDELADATANHLGVGVNQAMALLSIKPKQLGEMQKYADLSKVNTSGLANMGLALNGSSEDRQKLANSMLARKDVSSEDKQAIQQSQGNDTALRDLLARLSAKYGQEQTTGSDIRDSKNALDNIKTAIADQLVPLTNQMRLGIMHIAGKGKMTPSQVMAEVLGLESKDKESSIHGTFGAKIDAVVKRKTDAEEALKKAQDEFRTKAPNVTDEEREKARGNLKRLSDEVLREKQTGRDEVIRLREEEAAAIDKEREALKKRIEESKRAVLDPVDMQDGKLQGNPSLPSANPAYQSGAEAARLGRSGSPDTAPTGAAPSTGGRSFASSGSGSGGVGSGKGGDALVSSLDDIKDPEQRARVKAYLDTIAGVEGAGYHTLVGKGKNNNEITDLSQHPNRVGIVTPDGPSTAAGRYQITGSTWRGVSKKIGATDFGPENQDRAAIQLLNESGALKHIMDGNIEAGTMKAGRIWQGLPSGISPNQGKRSWGDFWKIYNESLGKHMKNGATVPQADRDKMPEREADSARSNGGDVRHKFEADPIRVVVENQRGEPVAPQQDIPTRIKTGWRPSMGY